jgi:putative SOS response-associated peptidase YedK
LLAGDDRAAWLAPGADAAELLSVPPSDQLVASLAIRPVGAAVGSVRNDGPHLLDPVPESAPATLF